MSNQSVIKNIMNQFESNEEEDEEKEDNSSSNSEYVKKHKKSSSLNEGSNNNIKEKLSNAAKEDKKKEQKVNRRRDEFGYFINDYDNNDENSENENEENSDKNDNNDDKEQSVNDNQDNISVNSSQKKESDNSQNEEIENENNNMEDNNENDELYSNKENDEEIKDNKSEENDDNYNNDNNDDNYIEKDKDNKENNNNNNINEDNNNNINNEEMHSNDKNIKNEENNINDKNKEDELINELYNKSKLENLDQPEVELFRMGSFRPEPIPGSPKFSKRISKNEEESNNKEKKIPPNNNLINFTETIETTIEGNPSNKSATIPNNSNNPNPVYTHNNTIMSLGKFPVNESFITKKNNDIEEENKNKSIEDEKKAEQEFLRREELKRQQNKEIKVNNDEIKKDNNNNDKKEEDEGKENVTEDEEDGIKSNKKNNDIKINEEDNNNINNNNIYIENNNEMNNTSKEKEINNDNSSNEKEINNNTNNKINNNDINEIKVRNISIKLLEQMQKEGNSQNSSVGNSHKNSGNINNNNINNINQNKMGVHRNIYSKKKIVPDINNNKNNKILQNNKIKNQNKIAYESPYDKKIRINNTNYTNDNINQDSSSNKKKISPFNYNINSNFYRQTSNKQDNIKNNLYNHNNDINSSYPNENKKMSIGQEKNNSYNQKNNIKNNSNKKKEQKRPSTPLGLSLYEKAKEYKDKLNNKYNEEQNFIIFNANKKKINDKSYNMVNKRLGKRIDNAINKFAKDDQLNIVLMTQCLYELNIITELIKMKDYINDNININKKNELDLVELQSMIDSMNGSDKKKIIEVELIEQLWFLLNPNLEQNINSQILSNFLKIFFCNKNSTFKELENDVMQLLDKYQIQKPEEDNNINNNDNDNNKEIENFKSPLRDKVYNKEEIWTLAQFVKVFIELKKNLKAYRENDNTKGDIYNNIVKETDKELTFSPDFISKDYFYKYSQFNYNKDSSIIDLINKYKNKNNNLNQKPKHDFNKVYERFKAEKEIHEKTLEKIREMQREKELKMCTNVPKINKYNLKSSSPISPVSNPTSEKKSRNNNIEDKLLTEKKTEKKQPRYKLLYELRKKYNKNDKVIKRIDKNDILDENCTFKPNITNNDIMNRTFSNLKNIKKPKGYNQYINRNRSFLKLKEKEKKLEEDKKYGRGYDKIQKMKIKPLNITDLNRSSSKDKYFNNLYNNNTDIKNKSKFNFKNDNIENIIENVYITLDIKLPNGSIKLLKIYNKNDNETIEDIFNFCKIYSLNDEVKKMLIQKALNYKNLFFEKNTISDYSNKMYNIKQKQLNYNDDSNRISNSYMNKRKV